MYAPYVVGLVVLLFLYLLTAWLTGRWAPLDVIRGADGRPSTSKAQSFIWTAMAIFAFSVLFTARAMDKHFEPIDGFPRNLLIAMGLSITTAVAAKAVTVSYLDSSKIVKTNSKVDSRVNGLGAILKNDDGDLDLSKIQMMAWTVIALGVYCVRLAEVVGTDTTKLPDIDTSLMVFMGLGQGAYLGQKLASTGSAKITGLSPVQGKTGTQVTISGELFGDGQGGGHVLMDGQPLLPGCIQLWSDKSIVFVVPTSRPDGTKFDQPRKVDVSVTTSGDETNPWDFTVLA